VDKGSTGCGGGTLGLVAMDCFQVYCLDGSDGLGKWLGSLGCGSSRIMIVAIALRPSDSGADGQSKRPTVDGQKNRYPVSGLNPLMFVGAGI